MTIILIFLGQDVSAQGLKRIQDIVIESNVDIARTLSENLIITQSGLKVGGYLSGEVAGEAIRRLWHLGLFSDVQILSENVSGGVKVIIRIKVLPTVNSMKTNGFKEVQEQEALNIIKLVRNMAIGERNVTKMRKQLLDVYHSKGFLLADVDFALNPLPPDSTKVDVVITMHEGKKVKIKSIEIEGNEHLSERKIKKEMETKESAWFRSGEYNEETYEKDKEKIITLYKQNGYRDIVILGDSLKFDENKEKVTLTIYLSEGNQYKFGKTTLQGNTSFTTDELLAKLKYQEGDVFNDGLSKYSAYEMTLLYQDKGYLKTIIKDNQIAHDDTVDVLMDIAEGNISKVSKVIIIGNTKTNEKVIRREISLLPGEAFNYTKLQRSQRDVQALNYFSKVEPDYELTGSGDEVNIKYKVEERQTGIASMGAGYSERDKLVGTLSFTNPNLLGRGQSINFSVDTGSRRKAFQIGFTEPWLANTPTSLTLDLYNIVRSDYTSAFDEEKRRGGYVRLGRKLKWPDYSHAYISYRLEDINYTNPSSYYQDYLITGKTSSISCIYMRDSRDLPDFATDGARTSITMEIAGGPLGGDLSYYKYLVNNEFYHPLFWKLSLCTRSQLGFLKGYKENISVPYSERFMPGGTSYDGIVRGYPDRKVCPLLKGQEIGGETMFVNNLELQIPIVAPTVYGIMFYDLGNAWRNLSETNPFDLKRSAGVGARLYIPQIGLVGFDIGYGFDKIEGSTKVGGWRTHFQFGNMW